MIPLLHLAVLRQLYTRLSPTNICWVLTGSLSFALRNIPVTPNDIDIQTDEAGAYALEQLFSEYVEHKVRFSSTSIIRSHFGSLAINGLPVEIMGDIQKRRPDGTWEDTVDLALYTEYVELEAMRIPVLALAYEYDAYKKLGRHEKAQMLFDALHHSQSTMEGTAQ